MPSIGPLGSGPGTVVAPVFTLFTDRNSVTIARNTAVA